MAKKVNIKKLKTKIKPASKRKIVQASKSGHGSKTAFIVVSLVLVAAFYSFSQRFSTGGIQITSYGDSNIEINGEAPGKTPYYTENVKEGINELRLKEINSGQVWSEKVNVVAGTLVTLHQEFNTDKNKFTSYVLSFEKISDKNKSTVKITGKPESATVTVDGKPYGFAPIELELDLIPHVFTFTSPGYEDKTINAMLNKGYQLNIKFTMASSSTAERKIADDQFPALDLPADYFDANNMVTGAGIDYGVLIDAVPYRSYPSANITLSPDSYSLIHRELPAIKSYSQMHATNPIDDFFGTAKRASIRKFGTLASRYTGGSGESIMVYDVKYADLDKDGKSETIVYISETGANSGPEWVVVIKDNKEIFSTSKSFYSSLLPAKNGNGFTLEWSLVKKRDGYTSTKFVFKDGKFVPVYEQLTRYIKISDE